MADFHIKATQEGTIEIGTVNKDGKWTKKSDVTSEALEAVRDHLLVMTVKEGKSMAFAWQYPNGKTLIMKLEEQVSEEVKEKPEENEVGE